MGMGVHLVGTANGIRHNRQPTTEPPLQNTLDSLHSRAPGPDLAVPPQNADLTSYKCTSSRSTSLSLVFEHTLECRCYRSQCCAAANEIAPKIAAKLVMET